MLQDERVSECTYQIEKKSGVGWTNLLAIVKLCARICLYMHSRG